MTTNYGTAVRMGVAAAARLHQRLTLREQIQKHGGNVDVFEAIRSIELPLLLRKLEGLLGVYLNAPSPGVLVSTGRPMSIQRFTAAHELGHHELKHRPSLDGDGILRRFAGPRVLSDDDAQEVAANAFAAEFLMPRWLTSCHCTRQKWDKLEFHKPNVVYQLSLRVGMSYEATAWTLARDKYISEDLARELLRTEPRELKSILLADYRPANFRSDVWLLTHRDEGTRIDGSRNDFFVLKLVEHSGGGYLWDFDQLKSSGFGIVKDEVEDPGDESIGGPITRRVTANSSAPHRGIIDVSERRPWDSDSSLTKFHLDFDLTGPEEEGLSRAERRSILEEEWP